jgi:hypothetical protein
VLAPLTASTDREIEMAFAAAVEKKVGALFVNIVPFFFSRSEHSPRYPRAIEFPRSIRFAITSRPAG